MAKNRCEKALEYANRGYCPRYNEFERVWLRMLAAVFRRRAAKAGR